MASLAASVSSGLTHNAKYIYKHVKDVSKLNVFGKRERDVNEVVVDDDRPRLRRSARIASQSNTSTTLTRKQQRPRPRERTAKQSKTSTALVRKHQHFRLFDLPRELQDLIFELAYPGDDAPIILKFEWIARDLHLHKTDPATHTTRPFPPPKASEWLISRRFFLAAANAWVGSQSFINPSRYSSALSRRKPTVSSRLVACKNGLYLEFATNAHLRLQDDNLKTFRRLLGCRRLKKLTVTVVWEHVDLTAVRYPWIEDMPEEDLKTLLEAAHLHKLSGLREVSMVVGPCVYAKTDHQKQILAANTQRLEQALRSSACKPREMEGASVVQGRQPLYHSSRVWDQQSDVSSPGTIRAAPLPDNMVEAKALLLDGLMFLLGYFLTELVEHFIVPES